VPRGYGMGRMGRHPMRGGRPYSCRDFAGPKYEGCRYDMRRFGFPTASDEIEFLTKKAEFLEDRLKQIKERISHLEGKLEEDKEENKGDKE